jgi:hypothetical protein
LTNENLNIEKAYKELSIEKEKLLVLNANLVKKVKTDAEESMRITTEKMNLQNDNAKCNAKIIEIEKNKMKCNNTVSNMEM